MLEAAVVARPDEKWGEIPCAFVTLKEGQSATEQEITGYCRDVIAHFKAPKTVIFGPLPKTSTGKIPKVLAARTGQGTLTMIQPDPETRQQIQDILARYLDALTRADVETIAADFTEDASLLPAGGLPVHGRDTITGWYRESFATGPRQVRVDIWETGGDGTLAYFTGRYHVLEDLSAGAAVTDTGKVVVIFRREAGQGLKKHIVISNGDGPAA